MSDKTSIEWTRGDDGTPGSTWNPTSGCTKVSPGCANCYIVRTPPFRTKRRFWDAKGSTGVWIHGERLLEPTRWSRPRRVFVNSLSDLFHEDIPIDFIDQVFAVMALCPQHTFQILTKRPERMLSYLRSPSDEMEGIRGRIIGKAWNMLGHYKLRKYAHQGICDRQLPLSNVWLGVTVENQHFADERIPLLLNTPAAVRFISYEPALGPVIVNNVPTPIEGWNGSAIKWVICGGESGPNARPMHPDWARSMRDQCCRAGVPFFFKQFGEWQSIAPEEYGSIKLSTREILFHPPGDRAINMIRVGKKKSGRLLDGREWNEYPS